MENTDFGDDIVASARREAAVRGVAVPGALAVAWFAVRTAPGPVRLLTMWIHETGHAVSAWLCGYSAWPGPWFTPVSSERSFLFTAVTLSLLAAGGYQAWIRSLRGWTLAAGAASIAVLTCTVGLTPGQAQQLIVFSGDGGCFVLGTALMMTMYADEEHPFREQGLRWALVVIGALAFADVWHVWSGPLGQLPFGENEQGLSDPSVLTEVYGWSILRLVSRYTALGDVCAAGLTVVYVAGLATSISAAVKSDRARYRSTCDIMRAL